MSSVALAAVRGAESALPATEAMLRALEDRAPAWAVSGEGSMAFGVGANEVTLAHQQIVPLPVGSGGLGIDMPVWARTQLETDVERLLGQEAPVMRSHVEELFSAVTGDCHCVAAFPPHGCAAYRGPMASRPLFYMLGDDRSLLVASQIRGIRAAHSTEIDVIGLAPFLVPQLCDPAGTCWRDVHRIPPGHLLTWWDGELEVRRVAQVDPLDRGAASTEELVREFRDRLLLAIARCSEPPDGLLLSGGIDSSALTCAYASIREGRSSCAYSLTYDRHLAACDERRFVNDVERSSSIPVRRLAGNRLLPLVAGFPEGDEPEPWPYASRNWALLRHIAADTEREMATVFAGEGGDELLLGQVFSVADRLARGDAVGGARELRTFPEAVGVERVVEGLLAGAYDCAGARAVRAVGDLPSWLTASFVDDANVLQRLADGYPRLGPPAHMTSMYSREVLGEMGAAGRIQCGGWNEDMGRKLGLKIAYPFLDPDLVALVWSLPPQLLRDEGREKVILRDALDGLLPSSVSQRKDKAEALALLHRGLGEAIDMVRSIAHDGPLADLGVIHPARFLAAVDRYVVGDKSLAPALWATASVDGWLKHQGASGAGVLWHGR